ncbi:hypothetical protein GCM10010121_076970 [Streptomyces brasiliensis]|uniref:Uncharacterized protein n=1 Tax=Streptomyces brasiliensis TaxID=1954 RepID=A0A917LDA9_9ACTN|nr:hypothetical protein GCM10010121_076970 [Streptomyces brasiliensis]
MAGPGEITHGKSVTSAVPLGRRLRPPGSRLPRQVPGVEPGKSNSEVPLSGEALDNREKRVSAKTDWCAVKETTMPVRVGARLAHVVRQAPPDRGTGGRGPGTDAPPRQDGPGVPRETERSKRFDRLWTPNRGRLMSTYSGLLYSAQGAVEALRKSWRAGWSPSPRLPGTPESRPAR